MADVDRYITDKVVLAAWAAQRPRGHEAGGHPDVAGLYPGVTTDDAGRMLRAAIPSILARHEKDVRRRVLGQVADICCYDDKKLLRGLADYPWAAEAVADE